MINLVIVGCLLIVVCFGTGILALFVQMQTCLNENEI